MAQRVHTIDAAQNAAAAERLDEWADLIPCQLHAMKVRQATSALHLLQWLENLSGSSTQLIGQTYR